ncbi:MAG: efflux RND transporter periplasmic adaptor subunit [Nitrosomonadales bacterium]|nr:MAG: efflux RND transporter periplasmic adaptor subunit [Nitrosomonadales bacterium]
MKKWFWTALWLASGAAHAVEVPAVLQWSQRVELSTPVSGVVQAVNVAVGERVRQGQVLLRLDERIYAGRVEEAAAMVARNREDAAEAQRELKRVQELYDRTVISVSELEQARMRQAKAAAQLKESQAHQRQELKNREDTLLRAPFDAVVVARQAEPGQAVAATLQPLSLLVVARAGEMLARAQVQEAQLASLKAGQEVEVSVGKQRFRGKVRTMGLEPTTRDKSGLPLYPLDVIFVPAETQLRAGAAAILNLP